MKIPIVFKGKKYKVTYFEYLAYQNQKQFDRVEKELDKLLNSQIKVEQKVLSLNFNNGFSVSIQQSTRGYALEIEHSGTIITYCFSNTPYHTAEELIAILKDVCEATVSE